MSFYVVSGLTSRGLIFLVKGVLCYTLGVLDLNIFSCLQATLALAWPVKLSARPTLAVATKNRTFYACAYQECLPKVR